MPAGPQLGKRLMRFRTSISPRDGIEFATPISDMCVTNNSRAADILANRNSERLIMKLKVVQSKIFIESKYFRYPLVLQI